MQIHGQGERLGRGLAMGILAAVTFASQGAAQTPATAPNASTPAASSPGGPARPLAMFASRPVLIYPAQRVLEGDSLGWAASIPDRRAYLADFDAEFAFAMNDRQGLRAWKTLEAVDRAVKRVGPYAPEIREMPVSSLIGKIGEKERVLPASLADPMRAVSGFIEARWALLPVAIRFERVGPATSTAGRAVLRVAFIDTRAGEVGWIGDIASDTASSMSPKLLASVAQKLADQIVAP